MMRQQSITNGGSNKKNDEAMDENFHVEEMKTMMSSKMECVKRRMEYVKKE